jgi:WXG100 family type VII secretion target
MANQIRMTPETMRQRANEYRKEAQTVEEVINRMDKLLTQLKDEWEGAASQAYAQKFSELRPGFVKAKDLINDIAAALDKTAQIVEQTDADIASQFRA